MSGSNNRRPVRPEAAAREAPAGAKSTGRPDASQWPMVRLGDVLTRSDETVEIDPQAEYRQITVRLWGKGVVERGRVVGGEIAGSRRFVARRSHFILSRIDARNGAVGIVPQDLDGAIVTNDFPVFNVSSSRLLPSFLEWMSRTADFVDLCRRASEGTTNRVRLQEERFLQAQIPLPPLSEQRRLVNRVSDLMASLDEARRLRREVAQETGALMDSLLWKTFDDDHQCVVELRTVCSSIIDNLHSNPRYADTGIPCVRSPDVGYGTMDLSGTLKTDYAEFVRRTVRGAPQVDDIVFVREGGGTGKCALVEDSRPFSLGQRVMMLRQNRGKVLPRFLLYQILSPLVQDEQIVPLCKGSASPHLNIGTLQRLRLVLPSISRQQEIVEETDGVAGEIAELKKIQEGTQVMTDALLPSILDRAFRGEL